MNGVCGDNRFEIIAKVKEHLLKATNIEMHPEKLAQADNILFRLWQLGYFKQVEFERENADLKKACDETQTLLDKQIEATYKLDKENAELKNQVSFLEDNLRVARKDRENLQLDVAKGLKEFVKDYPATAFRYLANEKYVERLTYAKTIIQDLLDNSDEYARQRVVDFLKECE